MTSFEKYINECAQHLRAVRSQNLQGNKLEQAIQLNVPFELTNTEHPKQGILLTHGFLGSPHIMQSLAEDFAKQGFLARAILLPGHGSDFKELDRYTWKDWLNTLRFGYETLNQDCEEIYLCGFSIGATLSLLLALELLKQPKSKLKKLILLAPCFGIDTIASTFPFLVKSKLAKILPHLFCTQAEKEHLASYKQFSMQSVVQIVKTLKDLHQQLAQQTEKLPIPIYISASTEDATVKFKPILNFANTYLNQQSHIRIYTNKNKTLNINIPNTIIDSKKLDKKIKAFSHVALPVTPNDTYFGINGSYYGQLPKNTIFGEPTISQGQRNMKRLTYNPDYQKFQQELFHWLNTST